MDPETPKELEKPLDQAQKGHEQLRGQRANKERKRSLRASGAHSQHISQGEEWPELPSNKPTGGRRVLFAQNQGSSPWAHSPWCKPTLDLPIPSTSPDLPEPVQSATSEYSERVLSTPEPSQPASPKSEVPTTVRKTSPLQAADINEVEYIPSTVKGPGTPSPIFLAPFTPIKKQCPSTTLDIHHPSPVHYSSQTIQHIETKSKGIEKEPNRGQQTATPASKQRDLKFTTPDRTVKLSALVEDEEAKPSVPSATFDRFTDSRPRAARSNSVTSADISYPRREPAKVLAPDFLNSLLPQSLRQAPPPQVYAGLPPNPLLPPIRLDYQPFHQQIHHPNQHAHTHAHAHAHPHHPPPPAQFHATPFHQAPISGPQLPGLVLSPTSGPMATQPAQPASSPTPSQHSRSLSMPAPEFRPVVDAASLLHNLTIDPEGTYARYKETEQKLDRLDTENEKLKLKLDELRMKIDDLKMRKDLNMELARERERVTELQQKLGAAEAMVESGKERYLTLEGLQYNLTKQIELLSTALNRQSVEINRLDPNQAARQIPLQRLVQDMRLEDVAIQAATTRWGPEAQVNMPCYMCNQAGHMSDACPRRLLGANAFALDGQPIAVSSDAGLNRQGRRTLTCYECGEYGHVRQDCPRVPVGETSAESSNSGSTSTIGQPDHGGKESGSEVEAGGDDEASLVIASASAAEGEGEEEGQGGGSGGSRGALDPNAASFTPRGRGARKHRRGGN